MAARPDPSPIVPDGWSVEDVRYHYDLGYWTLFVVGLLGTAPDANDPDVTYTVRHAADGRVRKIRLPGRHSPDALKETLGLLSDSADPEPTARTGKDEPLDTSADAFGPASGRKKA
ncbi:MAG TPA: hypothetical protein VH414_12045 [Lichenihabitans sp.]|jgi:hypothetical protein|nr:hypothetical protein [Lichenihabitans sp.]